MLFQILIKNTTILYDFSVGHLFTHKLKILKVSYTQDKC